MKKVVNKFKLLIIFILVAAIFLQIKIISFKGFVKTLNDFDINQIIDPTTNFFTQKENTTKVTETYLDTSIIQKGYNLVATNEHLSLYLDYKTAGIAVYDHIANYVWYSSYQELEKNKYTDTVKMSITSGITIECFDSVTLNEITKYSASQKDVVLSFDLVKNGVLIHSNFQTVGIAFDTLVTLDDNSLNVKVLIDTLKEIPYKTAAMKVAKNYKLKSVTVFPYFGADNYEINAYAFIPDGSGALIRYTDTSYDTAFIKRIYGTDLGLQNEVVKDYLKEQNNLTLPIYGINHGYNQAAFLAVAEEGNASTELHSYPYMYGNINLNRTFFKFLTREKINIQMSSGSTGTITLINSDPYTSEYSMNYYFLQKSDASYVGMAKKYKERFDIESKTSKLALKLDMIAQDYKLGLFGKNFIELTRYKDALKILKELKNESLNLEVNYIGYNRGGYFDNMQFTMNLDNDLGSKSDFKALNDFAINNNIDIFYYSNPLVTNSDNLAKKTIKKHNLEVFNYTFKSSLTQTGKVINPNYLATYFMKNEKKYKALQMQNFSFEYLGDACFSYRYNGKSIERELMIKTITSELSKINYKKLALKKPNNYLYNYIDSYYEANYESSKYAFITDSIPFISIVLSGHISLYGPNINYVSNALLYNLRLIEYNLNPSFVITYNSSNMLRYTNFEYLYTTEYFVWKDQIIETYNYVYDALKDTIGASIIGHTYIDDGIVKITYDNKSIIYINYTSNDYSVNGKIIKAMSYLKGDLNEEN